MLDENASSHIRFEIDSSAMDLSRQEIEWLIRTNTVIDVLRVKKKLSPGATDLSRFPWK